MKSLAIDRLETVPYSQTRVVLSLIVMLVVLAMSVFTGLQIERELEHSKRVQSDNRTWVLAQIQVDLQNMQISILKAAARNDAAALAEIRKAYDVLYSRVDLVNGTPLLEELSLRGTPAWRALAGKEGLVQRFLPVIDGADQALLAALPDMMQSTAEIILPVREMIVAALGESMQLGDRTRLALHRTLYSFLVVIVVTMVGLTLLFATIYRQARAQQRYARILELAVHNLRATIESAPDAVLIVNANDRVIGANTAGEVMLGCAISPKDPVALSDVLVAAEDGSSGTGRSNRMQCHGRNGGTVPVEVAIADVTTGTGDTFKIAFLRDMSQQLDRERQLALAGELARKGEEAKDRFLAVMSHEMRTPLSGLLSATDLLETTTTLDAPQAWLVGILKSCGLAALEQVNNILELTRLSASDANDFPLTDFCVNETVREQVKLYQALALDRGNTLTLSPEDAPPCMVHAPLPLLRRILNNLLSNAIKFTRNGAIDVVFMAMPAETPGNRRFTLLIRDTGVGIPEADLERIFHNFETLDSSYSRVQEGTGLGLGIAKLSAEAMGGTIKVESRVGEGTCFTVTFEAEVLPEAAAVADVEIPALAVRRPLTVLLAEDNEINSTLMERQMSRLGHRVVTVSDGIKAIAAVQRQQFDIILMDISMPHMDGVTATRHLIDGGLLGDTPVIALTAQASPDRVQMLCDAGMTDVVIKPVPMALLDELMQKLAIRARTAEPSTAQPESDALFDRERLDELIELMGVAELQRLLQRFRSDMQNTLSACATALKAGKLDEVSKAVHWAAGAAGMLTMDALCAQLRHIETAAATESPESLRSRFGKLDPLRNDSLSALQQALHKTRHS
ncbi:ATP-binding protein [Pseudotabrizicola sp. 4114]|uniref:ATP-binding protein n=1 Tax=Pseudotabrizicola sp. 4114 TaxID=2817731 RepID=UPI00285BEB4A|nr:signal transduction histidine kinase/DNA-binding response OmpR family regulator [Pseudorhodobacter sp. 4114]